VLAWPLAAAAQQPGRTYRLGALIPAARQSPAITAFFDEMRLLGFAEGHNLSVLPNGFDVRNDELAERAEAVVKAAPDAIISGPDNYARVLQQLTRTIPLIAMTEDMVRAGLVASLARPGGNTTGISLLSPELDGKRQDILIEAVPGMRRIATLADSTVAQQQHLDTLPAMHQWPELAGDGGLMGYGPRFTQTFRQRARIVARILRGANPADIPVEQPTHFELVINLRTAKAIGHEVPPALVLRADEVIE
jgi:ABC-type uncharacterized transport system substrate-binding protein